MIKIKVKLTAFSTVAAALLLSVSMPYLFQGNGVTDEDSRNSNIINFSAQFSQDTVDSTINKIKSDTDNGTNNERVLLKLTSPGGEVFSGKKLRTEMTKKGMHVDTYVPAFAASMGADIFMQGERRYVEPDAIVLFHGAHAGTYAVSQPILQIKLDILQSQEFIDALNAPSYMSQDPSNPMQMYRSKLDAKHAAYMSELLQAVNSRGYEVVLMELQSIFDIISTINETMLLGFERAIKQSNGKLTMDILREKVFRNFTQDVVLTGQQLYDLGLATDLGAPNEKDYRKN